MAMASVACTLPVLGLCIHTSGSPSVSGTAGCFSLEFRASAVFDRCDARRKQHQQRRRRRLPLRAPCCMSVDVDSEQDNVNSQLKSPQERDEGIPALNPRRGEYPRSDEFVGFFVKLCSVESFFLVILVLENLDCFNCAVRKSLHLLFLREFESLPA